MGVITSATLAKSIHDVSRANNNRFAVVAVVVLNNVLIPKQWPLHQRCEKVSLAHYVRFELHHNLLI